MPPPEIREEQRVLGEAAPNKRHSKHLKDKTKKPAKPTEQDMLLDLMGGSDMPSTDLNATVNGSQNTADLLADILGGSSSQPTQTASPPPTQQSNAQSIMSLFSSNGPSQPQQSPPQQTSSASADLFSSLSSPPPQQISTPTPAGPTAHIAYNKNGLLLTLQVQRSPQGAQILARFRNTSSFERFNGVGLQAAVPKSQKLQLNAINKTDLDGGEEATQGMRVAGVSGVSNSYFPLFICASYFQKFFS
jgi:AP-1 complex subunit gamma-1